MKVWKSAVATTKMKSSLKIALLTTTSLLSCTLLGELPTQAATLAKSEAAIRLFDFSLTPQNRDANSDRNSLALSISEDSDVDAEANGTLAFVIDENNQTVIDLDFATNVEGDGNKYFGRGDAASFASGIFPILGNETLSFNFEVDISLESSINNFDSESILNFGRTAFFLEDEEDVFVGGFIAGGILETNLPNSNNDDLAIFATPNVSFIDGFRIPNFGTNQESGIISLAGRFSQTFSDPAQVRLRVQTDNFSCSQAPQTDDPCTKVPEPYSIFPLIFGFIGFSLFFKGEKTLKST